MVGFATTKPTLATKLQDNWDQDDLVEWLFDQFEEAYAIDLAMKFPSDKLWREGLLLAPAVSEYCDDYVLEFHNYLGILIFKSQVVDVDYNKKGASFAVDHKELGKDLYRVTFLQEKKIND